jgi:ABC-2 type transport system permease protein
MAAMDLPEVYQMFGDFSNLGELKNYLAVEAFDVMLVLTLGFYAALAGSGALAGEEEVGTLETLLALPLARWHVVIAKVAALGLTLAILLAIMAAGLSLGLDYVGSQMPVEYDGLDMLWASLNVWPILMFYGMLGLFLGAYLPTRGLAASLTAAFLVVSYLVNNLGRLIELVRPYRPYSPLYHYSSTAVLEGRVVWSDELLILGFTALWIGLALLSFQRRDVTVHIWPWQRWTARRRAARLE